MKTKINCLCCVLIVLQVTVCHRRRGKGRGEEAAPDAPAAWNFLRLRVGPRAASDGGAWKDAPPLFSRPEILLNTVPACRRCSL